MAKTVKINILDRSGVLYSADAESLNLNTSKGYQTIFSDHVPFISLVEEGKLEVKGTSNFKLENVKSGLLTVDFKEITVIIKEMSDTNG